MDSYQRKKALIAADKPKYIGEVVEAYVDIQNDVVTTTAELGTAIKNFFTPEFLLRLKYRKLQQEAVNQSIE
jgi:hypothetical protein